MRHAGREHGVADRDGHGAVLRGPDRAELEAVACGLWRLRGAVTTRGGRGRFFFQATNRPTLCSVPFYKIQIDQRVGESFRKNLQNTETSDNFVGFPEIP